MTLRLQWFQFRLEFDGRAWSMQPRLGEVVQALEAETTRLRLAHHDAQIIALQAARNVLGAAVVALS